MSAAHARLFVELALKHAAARGVELVGFDCGDELRTVAVFRDDAGQTYARTLDVLLASAGPSDALAA